MANLYFGITTFLLCIIGYVFSYKQYYKDNISFALLLIMFCGLLLRVYAASDLYLHTWDERYHAVVAKNMIDEPFRPMLYENPVLPYDYKNWAGNHIWVHKQPVPLWTMALSMSIFGVNEIALRLPSIILSTLGIGITFFIARYLFNNRIALIAAFLLSIHGLIIEITAGRVATDHIDAFFLFFIQLSVLLAIKYFKSKKAKYNLLCGISLGLAILTKWLPALIVLPIWLLLAIDSKALNSRATVFNFLMLLVIITIVFIPWQWYIFTVFPKEASWESSFNLKHISEALEGHGQPFYYHLDRLRIIYGEIIYLPLIWFFYKTLRRFTNCKRWILAVWVFIPFVFFSFAKTKMQAYTLFTAPAIFIITALFWEYLYVYRHRFKYKFIVKVILFLLIALPIRYSIERVKPFAIREKNPQWAQELRSLDKKAAGIEKAIVFNSEHPIETMFYTDFIAYSTIPDSSTLSSLAKDNYEIFIRRKRKIEGGSLHESKDILLQGSGIVYEKWAE